MSWVLLRCWLGGRKGIRPVKSEWSDAGMVIYLERGADLHMAQLMPLPLTVSCFSKIQIGFTSLLPAYTGSPGQRAVKRVCVCLCFYKEQIKNNNMSSAVQSTLSAPSFNLSSVSRSCFSADVRSLISRSRSLVNFSLRETSSALSRAICTSSHMHQRLW